MKEILQSGNPKMDRTKVGTKSLFGKQLKFSLRNNTFPLMTTRKMFLRGIFAELMLFIRGQTNNQILEDQKISIWRGNTSREFLDLRGLHHMPVGDMGASYGFLFRHFGAKYTTCLENYEGKGIDQLKNVIDTIKTNPNDRRMIISLWDPTNLDNCPLPPCLYNYQFYVHNGELYCMMTQRSSDFAVAGGWNIATGALLTYLIANVCDLKPAELIWNLGDVHIYNNLSTQVERQITRVPSPFPKIIINKKENIEDFEFSDLELLCYDPQDPIEMTMNV
jgi:thymidylate synthase